MRRTGTLVASLADIVLVVAVFLPWAGVQGNAASVAGWGSSATPRLLGLFVLACAATALAFRSSGLFTGADDRTGVHVVATLLDGVAAILALIVVTGAGSFVGTNETAEPRFGAVLALLAALAGVATGVVAIATTPRRPAEAA